MVVAVAEVAAQRDGDTRCPGDGDSLAEPLPCRQGATRLRAAQGTRAGLLGKRARNARLLVAFLDQVLADREAGRLAARQLNGFDKQCRSGLRCGIP